MKFRNQFLKYKLNCHTSPDGGDAGGGDSGGDGNGGQSNDETNLTSLPDPWQTNDAGEESGSQPAPAKPTATAAATPEEIFNNHVAGIDFTAGINVSDMQTAMQNQDSETFNKGLRSIGEAAYRQAMIDTNKVLNSRLDTVKDEINQNVSTATATDKAVSQLNSALPYTGEPMYKPVADEVFARYLKQPKMTVEKAIELTGEYFQKFSADVSKLNPKAPSPRSGGGFGEINEETGGDWDGQDWMSFLGSPQ